MISLILLNEIPPRALAISTEIREANAHENAAAKASEYDKIISYQIIKIAR